MTGIDQETLLEIRKRMCERLDQFRSDDKLVKVRLQEIEERVKRNMKKYEKQIEAFEKELDQSEWNCGRMRPKDPTEAKILSRFKQK
ncbi:hypothetical protein [Pseudobacillus badius]|uniref:hypothetical protein n=1 Tax=Bacillus badius TaxID=1455 RepID=UPI0007B39735|nr:hypothetical protein [Bacillus badius]KZR57552.1 hypothetical protein A3781_01850 [Bacillus badius]